VPASWHRVQHPSDGTKVLGGLGTVIHLGDMTPGPHLGEEFLAGKEPVHQEVQCQGQSVTVSVQSKSPRDGSGGSMHV